MSNVAELPTKDTITLIINRDNVDKVTYVFKNRYGNKIGEYLNKSPATLSSQSNVARQFKQIINPNGELKPRQVNNQFSELKQLLQLHYENELSVIEQEIADKKQAEQEKDSNKLKEAITKLQSLSCPLVYIGSLVEWFTAGERNNIMYAFTVICRTSYPQKSCFCNMSWRGKQRQITYSGNSIKTDSQKVCCQ